MRVRDTATDPAASKHAGLHAPEVRAWMSQNLDQRISRQRSQADTAKLVSTFTLALAGTLLATALQVEKTSQALNLAGSIFLGIAFILTLLVVWLAQVVEPDTTRLAKKRARPMIVDDVAQVLADIEADSD